MQQLMVLKLLNVAAILGITVWVMWLMTQRKHALSAEARRTFFGPLSVGLVAWVIERVADTIARAPDQQPAVARTWLMVFFLFSAVNDVSFFVAGRNIVQLKYRLLTVMEEITPDPPFWGLWTRIVCTRPAFLIQCVLAILPLILFSLFGVTALVSHLSDISTCIGTVVLGMGLSRELTRHKIEFVGMFSGLSIVFYGLLQLVVFRDDWLVSLYTIAFFLKVFFAFAIVSFWVLIGEISRAGGERVTVIKPPLRADLHDVCGKLDAMAKFAQVACAHLDAGKVAEAQAVLSKIGNQADLQNEFLRGVLGRLRSEDGALGPGLAPAISKLIDELRAENHEVRFGFQLPQGQSIIAPSQEECFYVVTRESLRNALRHAKDLRSVNVILEWAEGRLVVEDDGQGAGPPAVAPPGHGIEIMQECAARARASLIFEGRPPHGTRVKLEVANAK